MFYTTASEKTQGKKQKAQAKLLLDCFCAKQTDGSTELVSANWLGTSGAEKM